MSDNSSDLIPLEKRLLDLLASLRDVNSDSDKAKAWLDVTSTAQSVANGLRIRDGLVDNHTLLGKSSLPHTLYSLYRLALNGSKIPDTTYTAPVLEILRVSANLCMDHDDNRALLLDVGLPQALVDLLEGYSEAIPSTPESEPLSLSIPHLKVIRTAVGVLLNASVGFEPVKFRLISLEAGMIMIRLSTAIYPPSAWLKTRPLEESDDTPEDLEESWTIRSGLSNWVWRTVSELKDTKDETLQVLSAEVLPSLTPSLVAFTPPHMPTSSAYFTPESSMFSALLQADFETLEESCTQIESLSLDVEDVRLSLARGFQNPAEHSGIPCLSLILDFIEKGECSPLWEDTSIEFDAKRKAKSFDICRTALIKSVVEVAGEDQNEEVLWDHSTGKHGGEFVCRMVEWIKRFVLDTEKGAGSYFGRTDIVICASLSLGNLLRQERNAKVLLSAPHSLAPILASKHLLSPSTDIKVKHGVLGLLKHLAQSASVPSETHSILGQAGILQSIIGSGVWDEKADAMADVVQLSAIGVVKHMCNSNVDNTIKFVLPSADQVLASGLSQVLALVKRSESIPVKSEGTRVLVNIIKSLWSNDIIGSPVSTVPPSTANGNLDTEALAQKEEAMRSVLTLPCASALASLVGRSGKYPLLVNEGVVALTLLGTQRTGAPLVLEAILAPLSFNTAPPPAKPPSASTSVASDVSSPEIATPPSTRSQLPVLHTPLDMLIAVLKNVDNPVNFQVEVRINVCSLFIQIGRNASSDESTKVKETVKPVMEKLSKNLHGAEGKEEMLAKAIRKVLDTWA